MDAFDELLRGIRANGVGLGRRELSPPWVLRPVEDASLTLYTPVRGGGWLTGAGAGPEPLRVAAGDTVVVRGPGPFVLADRPPSAGPVGPAEPAEPAEPVGDTTVLLSGTYRVRGRVAGRLLDVLPPVLVVPGGDGCAPVLDLLDAQAAGCPPGQQVVLDRLFDWVLVCALREWFDGREAGGEGWFGALGDETVGPALRAMHAAPDRPWTLAALAREAGVSRTTLAGRFTRLVGAPPLAYLTDWRMTLAADLLAESPDTTVAVVARRVGYADAFGFSAAFKRFHGLSPTAYRASCRPDADCVGAECAPA
ncbi:AraC family transcriptional regulator [Streptomyces hainanensis]|uniref:AraC family transcriptional regulator n=1 Tax=Streptomyces hainanensis TaxID=402648 RepID=A0A4V2Y2T4_9ACTN|nr:AraC family transcriptional regulator [Streptomyces hainanensis]TDC73895.1 AraC family transcriptional regulator [Streptomyces hainanensis]